jgi:hypothetical protein
MALPTVTLEPADIDLGFRGGRVVGFKLLDSAMKKLEHAGYTRTTHVHLHFEQVGPMLRVHVTNDVGN